MAVVRPPTRAPARTRPGAPVRVAARAPVGEAVRAPARPAPLDQSGLMHLLGYAATLAAVAARRRFARQLAALGLRTVEFSILVLVDTNPEVNQRALGETLDVSPPNLAVVLDRMAGRGWLRRERSERDRRACLIRLTPAGQALCRRAHRISLRTEEALLAVLSPEERARLVELLHRVVRGGPPGPPGPPASRPSVPEPEATEKAP